MEDFEQSVTMITLTKKASDEMKNKIISSMPFFKKAKTKVGKKRPVYRLVHPKI